ncbi:gamma carbonic anhydrase family protein [Candidatus Neoehrlichia procyonis]|uniref:Hexapeptide transferase family protein n=1 Tax=Candidatus Neoehrlichia procyonis str. RAC413 TaxID=1359163 RepID=A0A0F3NRD2_9RICK|nr:gamma carbonic anhydrase family protein [Candidatus Neoehrlichia lotoris]KJV69469.1 hexapeptide transferase family protein [Candidatus Neoehrlichia lotoris str. RAC413]
MSCFIKYQGSFPVIDDCAFVADGAFIIGKVFIKKNVSIWYNAVLRGDVGEIYIDDGTNVQDGTVIHVDRNNGDTRIGKMVTIGHCAILHACTIFDKVFIGMGSIVMDNAIMENYSMLAAGSILTKGKIVKSGELWSGRPAKFFRKLSEEEMLHIDESAHNYIELSRKYSK